MTLLHGDSLTILKDINDNSIDLIVTDPPYGIEFMGKDWDKALPSIDIWKECFRVLKTGKLAFVMCSPRQDVLSRMIISLEDSGFRTNYTSIYWTYASGFPKAANVSKLIDKKAGAERTEFYKVPIKKPDDSTSWGTPNKNSIAPNIGFGKTLLRKDFDGEGNQIKSKPATEEAKKMEGAYIGFQPKPAVEIILVVSKGKTLTWLDSCRIPYSSDSDLQITSNKVNKDLDKWEIKEHGKIYGGGNGLQRPEIGQFGNEKGRFPANLLVSDDVLNDGKNYKNSTGGNSKAIINQDNMFAAHQGFKMNTQPDGIKVGYGDSGSYSRYFDLDKWFDKLPKTYPFLVVAKASKSEKNKGCEGLEKQRGAGVLMMRHIISDTISVRENEPNTKDLGKYLKSWRLEKNLSIKDVAKHFPSITGGLTGCVWNWEAGESIPTEEEWIKLKSILQFDDLYDKQMTEFIEVPRATDDFAKTQPKHNYHPTVKPLKLFSYLITMGSRENDIILDPFCGSGTTLIAADNLSRKYIGIEINKEYLEIAKHRLLPHVQQTKLLLNLNKI